MTLPCILYEDEHLLVVNKPPGWSTHAPSPYSGEGLYDWLRHREPRWSDLALVHRLDKGTSGVLVLAKTSVASRSLTRQFAEGHVRKIYRLLSDRAVDFNEWTERSAIVRVGDRYVARPPHAGAPTAVTVFKRLRREGPITECLAEPRTGRTHQIRVHAAAGGFPILGDAPYGGAPACRLCLHAESLELSHPQTGSPLRWHCPAQFQVPPAWSLRQALIAPDETTAYRLHHGAADGQVGVYLDVWNDLALVQQTTATPSPVGTEPVKLHADIEPLLDLLAPAGLYQQELERRLRGQSPASLSPRCVRGLPAPGPVIVRENNVHFEIRFDAGYSVGLFLDQRDNRRRLRCNHVAAGFPVRATGLAGATLLNAFAYTCGFSVAAALAGARTTSVDLSRASLAWGRRNFLLNQLNPETEEFLAGDVFDWFRRLGRKGRRFDVVVLDPPTFSQSKSSGVFRAEAHYGRLLALALPLLARGGVLLACTNAAAWRPESFLSKVAEAIHLAGRRLVQRHYAPQPPDFPVTPAEPAYLKTVWCRVE